MTVGRCATYVSNCRGTIDDKFRSMNNTPQSLSVVNVAGKFAFEGAWEVKHGGGRGPRGRVRRGDGEVIKGDLEGAVKASGDIVIPPLEFIIRYRSFRSVLGRLEALLESNSEGVGLPAIGSIAKTLPFEEGLFGKRTKELRRAGLWRGRIWDGAGK